MGNGSESPPSSERREAERHLSCFPAHIETPGGTSRTAVVRDLSVTGTLLLTRAKLKVGETVSLCLHLEADRSLPVRGTVVRFVPEGRDVASVWPHCAAVHFHDPLVGHEHAIKELAEHQARLGVQPLEGALTEPEFAEEEATR